MVNISVAPNFLIRWLMPRMSKFQELYPDVELQITTSLGLIDFSRSNTDMAVYFGNGDWKDIEMYFLRSLMLVPVCSPVLMRGPHPLKQVGDLKHHTLIYVSSRKHEWDDWLELAGAGFMKPKNSLAVSNGHLATAAALDNLGVALADITLTSREVESGRLVIPFDIPLDSHKAFYLVYRKHRPLTVGMKAFKEWLMQEMDVKDSPVV